MTMPRALILSKEESVYHCISRCVRRAYLCGEDAVTGKSFDHRKDWVHQRLIFLTQVFSIEVLAYALMSTHCHNMLRTRPDWLAKLDDKEIVLRWLRLYPKRQILAGTDKFN